MNQMYGFEGEVKTKYSAQCYELFCEVFNLLPLAHCINKRVLVMHGGIFSEDNVTLDVIRKTDRNRQPPDEGVMTELLWSDPMNAKGRAPSKRGVGVQFGPGELFGMFYASLANCVSVSRQMCRYHPKVLRAQWSGLHNPQSRSEGRGIRSRSRWPLHNCLQR